MKLQVQLLIAAVLISGLAGCCSEEGKRRAGAVDPAAAAPAAAIAAAPLAAGADAGKGMKLQVQSMPGVSLAATVQKASCENGLGRAAEVAVQWKVDKVGVSTVRVLVAGKGEQPKIWHEGGAEDAKTTGPWIDGGARLELVDAGTLEPLGTITAEATACGQ